MITYSTKENLVEDVEAEVQVLNSYLMIQTSLTNQISVFINSAVEKPYLDDAIINLNRIKQNISMLKNLLDILENLKTTFGFLTDSGLDTYIQDYNSLYTNTISTIFTKTSDIEKFIHDVSLELVDVVKEKKVGEEESTSVNCTNTEVAYNSLVDNTLVISEIRNQVILPYNLENIKLYFNNHLGEFESIEDLIKKNYTFPLSHFKPAAIARFREAYSLIKNKEKGSRFNALSLAFELLVNYNLHPAIIAACKSIDELDIYLACLEENELESFKKFNIKYEIPPAANKKSKKDNKLYQFT